MHTMSVKSLFSKNRALRVNPQTTVEIQSRVAFKASDFLFREFYVGNTVELTWSARSPEFKGISITNT